LALLYHGDAELHVESHAGRTAVSIHLPSSTDAA
jgi:hypothetical protein